MSTPSRLMVVAAIVLLSACGGSSGGSSTPSLSISPPSATVIAGSGATNFTATRANTTGAVTWTLSGPGSITPTTGDSTAYTPPATVTSATSATLVASTDTLAAHATITINPPPTITVAGTLLGNLGTPLNNVTVAIGTAVATTDAAGHFSIPNVTTPYDLGLVLPGARPVVGVYQGLTRDDPTLIPFLSPPGPNPLTGILSGNVSGGDALPAASDRTAVSFGSPETYAQTIFSANPYSLKLVWSGPTVTTGTVHALQWSPATALAMPTAYSGHGMKAGVVVSNGGTTSNADVAMSPVTSATVAGSISAPSGYTISVTSLSIDFTDGATFAVGQDSTGAASFNVLVPASIDSTTSILAVARDTASPALSIARTAGIQPGTSSTTVTLPPPALPSAPADAATGVTDTTNFTWTAPSGGVHFVVFVGASDAPLYYVVTTGTTTQIPDLPALGHPLPAATEYSWLIITLAPFTDMDALAGPGNTRAPGLVPAVGTSFSEADGPSRTFTTQ